MSTDWELISVTQVGQQKTPCDCCGTDTTKIDGELATNNDWLGFYSCRFTENHRENGVTFNVWTGDWSENATADKRWHFAANYSVQSEGFQLLDTSQDSKEKPVTHLDRDDILGSQFASEAFAMLDAIFMKDSRLEGWTI